MLLLNSLLFCMLLLLALGAVAAFGLFVIKPLQTRWAIAGARKILNAGQARSELQFRTVYRTLATARNDLEATKLWRQLDELKDLAGLPVDK
jgi:hypothetical protein